MERCDICGRPIIFASNLHHVGKNRNMDLCNKCFNVFYFKASDLVALADLCQNNQFNRLDDRVRVLEKTFTRLQELGMVDIKHVNSGN